MHRFLRFLLPALGAVLTLLTPAGAQQRLRRDQSFLGIHFDFHAGPDCNEVGKNTTPEMVNAIIDKVHPDYLQIDCKGHPGYSSYPTEVGHPVPGFVGDPLAVWRKTTAERGVALYMHYSGVYDIWAVQEHPEWAIRRVDGSPDPEMTSTFGPYVDRVLIPQLKELAGKYGVDGAWVDGECWATHVDYSDRAVRLFCEETGADHAPRSVDDPLWYSWKQFNREAFRRYLRHYVGAVHNEYPDFQICSNWAFTHHMYEPVSADVDFLSGDYSPENSINWARAAARYLSGQGKSWDLMAWSFTRDDHKQKPAVQLARETAVTLSQGGGCQVYFQQDRTGAVDISKMDAMAEVAEFARARQPWCHHSMPVPQVALLVSTFNVQHHDIPGNEKVLYPYYVGAADGILQCLLECQYSVDLRAEDTLLPDPDRYPLIVVPQCDTLSSVFVDDLLAYAQRGGSLLVIGRGMSRRFARHAGLSRLEADAWTDLAFGEGRLGFIPEDIADDYAAGRRTEALRTDMSKLVHKLFPDPVVEVAGSPWVDVTASTKEGKFLVHLVNTSGDHAHQMKIPSIDPVGPLEVSIRCPEKPRKILLQPEGKACRFRYRNGKATLTLDRLDIYEILEVIR